MATSMIRFRSLRSARAFVRGYCVARVVALDPKDRVEPFVICTSATAKRNRWNEFWPVPRIRDWKHA